jgi:hypothetical protein
MKGQLRKDLECFQDAISQLDKHELEAMLIQLAWKETTIEQIVESVINDF